MLLFVQSSRSNEKILKKTTATNNWLHIPKHASLISVLSVLWMIFTTNITASGVRNEIAWEEVKTKRKQLLLEICCRTPRGLFCRSNIKWLLPQGKTWTNPLFRVNFHQSKLGGEDSSFIVHCGFCSSFQTRFKPPQHLGYYSCLRLYLLLSGQILFFLFAFFAGKALKTKADIHNELI